MKRSDLIFLAIVAAAIVPFYVSSAPGEIYAMANDNHPYLLAFLKFATLATVGEMVGLRIRSGQYTYLGFGVAPRSVLWGLYGVWIALAMKVFAIGAPVMVETLGFDGVVEAMKGGFTPEKLLGAFSISLMMNTAYAPVFMTLHKVTDMHIIENGGSLKALIRPVPIRRILSSGLDWDTQWSFVFKRTIPLFWIPAHTITFLLPASFQVLFAALLSIALGVIMAIATVITHLKIAKM